MFDKIDQEILQKIKQLFTAILFDYLLFSYEEPWESRVVSRFDWYINVLNWGQNFKYIESCEIFEKHRKSTFFCIKLDRIEIFSYLDFFFFESTVMSRSTSVFRKFKKHILTLLQNSENRKYHQNLEWSLDKPWLKYLRGPKN